MINLLFLKLFQPISASAAALDIFLNDILNENTLLRVFFGDEERNAMSKEIQLNPVTHEMLLHVTSW